MSELEQIPLSPGAPSLGRPENFRTEAEPFVNWWDLLPERLNPFIAALNTILHDVNQALQTSNYVGNWSDLTGALARPASVKHNGNYWLLNADLADVTTSEPSVTTDWEQYTLEISAVDGLVDALSGLTTALNEKQATLVSGTNIKTLNGQDLTGSGDVTVSSGTKLLFEEGLFGGM